MIAEGHSRYSAYKRSGNSMLGDVPSDWSVARIAHVFVKANAGEVIDKSYWGDGIELLYTCNRTPLSSDYSEFPDWKRTVANDLLLTRNGTPYVHKPIVGAIYSNVVQRITLAKEFSRDYLSYCLGNSALAMRGYGVSIESFNFDNWKSLRFAHPTLEEQTQIAKFLDYETAKIDALIEKQQQLIALLKEKRQAVISHTVTKGLNPDAPMRDSGIEWIGRFPAHWTTCPLMHIVDPLRQVMYGIVLPGPDVSVGVPIVKGGDVKPECLSLQRLKKTTFEIEIKYGRSRLKANDLVYAIRGGVGDVELVPTEIEGANLTQDAARIAPAHGILPSWLLMSLRGNYFWRQIERRIVGATVRGINIRDLKRGVVAVPPEEEQLAIAEFLQRRLAKLKKLQDNLEAFLVCLQERRTALISAAVTGKIDVRGWKALEPETEAEVA